MKDIEDLQEHLKLINATCKSLNLLSIPYDELKPVDAYLVLSCVYRLKEISEILSNLEIWED